MVVKKSALESHSTAFPETISIPIFIPYTVNLNIIDDSYSPWILITFHESLKLYGLSKGITLQK